MRGLCVLCLVGEKVLLRLGLFPSVKVLKHSHDQSFIFGASKHFEWSSLQVSSTNTESSRSSVADVKETM